MNNEVCIVCDWKDANPFPAFIEAEVAGRSVKFDWRDRADGLKELVIPTTPPAGARDAVTDAATSLRGLASTIRKYGTCAPAALELVAERLEAALTGKADVPRKVVDYNYNGDPVYGKATQPAATGAGEGKNFVRDWTRVIKTMGKPAEETNTAATGVGGESITTEMVEAVECEVGMSAGAWDMVDPRKIIAAARAAGWVRGWHMEGDTRVFSITSSFGITCSYVSYDDHKALLAARPGGEGEPTRLVTIPLNDATRFILGRPNFVCGPYAHLMRAAGIDIRTKAEDEQAAVLHWMLNHYLAHGDDFQDKCNADLAAWSAAIAHPAQAGGGAE